MERLGGRVQPASGSLDGYKGDGRVYGKYRIETKYTTKASYVLKLAELFKIASETTELEQPVFVIDFKDGDSARTIGRFAVVPFTFFEKIANEAADDR